MTTSRCSHLPEVLPDCTSSAAPVVKTVEDCDSLVNGQPQYVMQVSAKDGQLLSTVVRTLATQSPFNDRPMCRICHEGSSQEDLLSPCECTGTLGTIHRSCLEHWLSSSNTSYCELCHFRFAVERKPRPLVEWLRNPGPQHEKRTLFGDMVCFLFITPLATISGWLCLRGAVDHLHFSSRLEAVGLIALTVALFTIYLFWTLVPPQSPKWPLVALFRGDWIECVMLGLMVPGPAPRADKKNRNKAAVVPGCSAAFCLPCLAMDRFSSAVPLCHVTLPWSQPIMD